MAPVSPTGRSTGGLDASAVAAFAEQVLGGPLADADLYRALWRTGGDAACLRELLLGGAELDVVRWHGDRFRVEGDLPTHRLEWLVERLRRKLPPAGVAALETLAWGEPLAETLAARLLGRRGVAALERAGVLVIEVTEAGRSLRLAPPVLGTAVREGTDEARREQLLGGLAAAHQQAGLTDLEPVRLARWHRQAGGGSAALFDRAARDAYAAGEYEAAEDLAAAALERGAGYTAAAARGAALGVIGRIDEALEVLRASRGLAGTGLQRAWGAIAESHVLGVDAAAWDEADEVLALALDGLDPAAPDAADARRDLLAQRALQHALSGRVASALVAAEQVLAAADASDRARLLASVAATSAAALRLEHPPGTVVVDRARFSAQTRRALPLGVDLIEANRLLVQARSAREPGAMLDRVLTARRQAFADGAWERAGLWSAVLGQVLLHRGELTTAITALRDALHLLDRVDTLRLRPVVAADLALAAVQSGDLYLAEESLARTGVDRTATPRVATRAGLVTAWLTALRDGPSAGVQAAIAAGDRAADLEHRSVALEAWHLAVRLGRPRAVQGRLAALDRELSSPLMAAVAAHAPAVDARDPEALEEVLHRFVDTDQWLLAAETAVQAAASVSGVDPVSATRGALRARVADADSPEGARLTALAATLRQQCPGADTPPLRDLPGTGLTVRQLEVARMARDGDTSRTIARRLDLSERTVDNHLAAAYRKLGVRGRHELPRVLSPDRALDRLLAG